MKLSECTFGRVVATEDNYRIGHIVGFTYNIDLQYTGGMSPKDLFERTIVVVKFPCGEQAIHPANIHPFKD